MLFAIYTFISTVTLFLGILPLYNRSTRNVNTFSFFLFTLFSALWSALNYVSLIIHEHDLKIIIIRLVLVVTVYLVASLVVFSTTYPNKNKINIKYKKLALTGTLLTSIIMLFPSTIPEVIIHTDKTFELRFGPTYSLFIVFIVSCLVTTIILLIKKYKKSYGLDKIRLQYLFLGLFSGIFISFVTNFIFVFLLNNTNLVFLGPMSLLIVDCFIIFSILKHRFLGIRFVLGYTLYYFTLGIYLYAFFYLITIIETKLFDSVFAVESMVIGIFVAIAFIFSYAYFSAKLKNLVNKSIIELEYDSDKEKLEFSKQISKLLSINELAEYFHTWMKRFFNPDKMGLFFFDTLDKNHVITKGNLIYDSDIINKIRKHYKDFQQNIITIDEIEIETSHEKKKGIIEILSNLNIQLMILLHDEKDLLGVILSSSKANKEIYTINDLKFIEGLLNSFQVSLERAVLYSKTERFNATLKSKIHSATKALRKQKVELQEKYQFEKDMMGIMGHELRTPMTVAKGMAELVLARAKKNDVEPEYVAEKMEKIYDSIIKEADLIQTMLSTSHVDNNKLNFQIGPVDLLDCIEYSMSAFKKDATNKKLKLEFIKPKFKVPILIQDPARTQEIVNNLVSNAVKYTNEGSVTITLTKDDQFIFVNVKDTGIGIPDEEIQNIGQKFYRINQHLDEEKQIVRAGGTGLGLYVVKGVLKAFGGELRVESKLGKGSTFTAVFPIESKFADEMLITMDPTNQSHDMFKKMGLHDQ